MKSTCHCFPREHSNGKKNRYSTSLRSLEMTLKYMLHLTLEPVLVQPLNVSLRESNIQPLPESSKLTTLNILNYRRAIVNKKRRATATFNFDLGDNTFPEHLMAIKKTGPILGLHSMIHNCAASITTHGSSIFFT